MKEVILSYLACVKLEKLSLRISGKFVYVSVRVVLKDGESYSVIDKTLRVSRQGGGLLIVDDHDPRKDK